MPATINCANYVYFEALKDLQQLQCMEAITVFMDELLNLHRGQAMDIYWRDNVVCPTEEQYMEMVQNSTYNFHNFCLVICYLETGGLFRLAVGLMQSKSENKANFSPLVNKLASLFQILDDYLNIIITIQYEYVLVQYSVILVYKITYPYPCKVLHWRRLTCKFSKSYYRYSFCVLKN